MLKRPPVCGRDTGRATDGSATNRRDVPKFSDGRSRRDPKLHSVTSLRPRAPAPRRRISQLTATCSFSSDCENLGMSLRCSVASSMVTIHIREDAAANRPTSLSDDAALHVPCCVSEPPTAGLIDQDMMSPPANVLSC
jgi:hypothetical protein